MKELAKEHICIAHRCRQPCSDGQREGGRGQVGGEKRWGKWQTSVIVITIELKNKREDHGHYIKKM